MKANTHTQKWGEATHCEKWWEKESSNNWKKRRKYEKGEVRVNQKEKSMKGINKNKKNCVKEEEIENEKTENGREENIKNWKEV